MTDTTDRKNTNENKEKADEYRQTVFLPKTEFPMRGGLPQKEPEIINKWNTENLYQKMRDAGKGKEKYILHDGPPYANGNIHIGHAVNKILKDVVVKSYSMMGYDAPYVPGWDCHGLPIEWKIEEKYRAEGKNKDDVDILTFREECRKFAREWVGVQSEQFQRLGVTGDWNDPYLTMTNPAEAAIVKEIHKFALNGGLYKGLKPVMWSTVEKTALAEAEVEYAEHKSITVWVKFPVVETKDERLKDANVVIWTTTPWTLPSNRAVAYGHFNYVAMKIGAVEEGGKATVGDVLIVAEELLEQVCKDAKITEHEIVHELKGEDFEGTICAHPLRGQAENGYFDYDVPMLYADFVTTEAGTGFVHTAPSHGADDFILGKEHGLEITDNVTDDGKFRPHVPLFAGLEIYDQNGKMGPGNFAPIKAIEEAGMLVAKGSVRHEYPHSWRSKAPVIFRATPQWFIAMDNDLNLREKALNAIKDTKWVPAKGEARITAMIEKRPDWCISRQRAWGVPIALFLHKETGEVLVDADVFERISDIFESEGSDAWWSENPQKFLGDKYKAEDYTQVFDIVDVWFESGSTHAFVCEAREELRRPEGKRTANLYLEGSDQHRGWFHSSLLESCGTRGTAPYDAVLTHGFVLDEKGYKMSKSLGNVVDPLKVMEQSGADILRLWTLTSDYAEDIRIGKDTLKNTSDLYRRIRNTLRFLLGALDGFTKDEAVEFFDDPKQLPELEQYVLHMLAEMDEFVRDCITNYEFGKLANRLHHFCNNDLSAFYFDIRKDSLYCDRPDDETRRACRSVMAVIFNGLSAWLAPILCFTAEEAWQHRPAGVFEHVDSVHLREFPEVPKGWKNDELANKWSEILKARKAVLEAIEPLRAEKTIRSSLEASVTLKTDVAEVEAIADEMADICIVSTLTLEKGDEAVSIKKAEGAKCERCWKVLPEVSEDTGLCNRCADAVEALKKSSKAA